MEAYCKEPQEIEVTIESRVVYAFMMGVIYAVEGESIRLSAIEGISRLDVTL